MPATDLTAVIVGLATAYTGPQNEPLPANSVALGGSWAGNWLYTGATDSGVALGHSKNTNDIMIEEQSTPALITVTSSDIGVTITLAEDTIENMKVAYGSGSIVVNAGATPPNKVYTFNDTLATFAIAFEGLNKFGKARRVYVPSAIAIAQADTAYRRAAANRTYATRFRAICPPTSITVTEITG